MFEVVYLNLLHGLLQLLDPVIRTIGVLVIDPIEHQINVFPFFAPLAGPRHLEDLLVCTH